MKKILALTILIITLAIAFFVIPVGAFTVNEEATYNPSSSVYYPATQLTGHIKISYPDSNSYSRLIYKTQLENAKWKFKIYHNNLEEQARVLEYEGTSGNIPWFDIYEPNTLEYVDITVQGTIPSTYASLTVFNVYDTMDNTNNAVTSYESAPIKVYVENPQTNPEQQLMDLAPLKSQMEIQENYISEMSLYSDVSELSKMMSDFKTELNKCDSNGYATVYEYSNLNNQMDAIAHSVVNYQTVIMENNLKKVASVIKDTSYYDEYMNLYNKWKQNDYSDNAITKSYNIVIYAQKEIQNKETLQTTITVLVVVVVGGGLFMFFVVRARNRRRMQEEY